MPQPGGCEVVVAEAGFSVDIRDMGVKGWFPTVSASVEVSL